MTNMNVFVAYLRLSKKRKSKDGQVLDIYDYLGMQAQDTAVQECKAKYNLNIVKVFTEIETGKKNDRPELLKALDYCRRHKVKLLIAKLDRVSRRLGWVTTLIDSVVHFRVAEYFELDPKKNRFFFYFLGMKGEMELKDNSDRTKAALAEARKNGVVLGKNGREVLSKRNKESAISFALKLKPIIDAIRARDITSVRLITRELRRKKIKTFHGKRWHVTTVQRLLKIIDALPNQFIQPLNQSA